MSNITLPNPLTPLAFLPPALAAQFEVSRYLYAVTLGAYIWDSAVNLGNDYQLLFKSKIRFPTVVYYLSRIFTYAYILTCFVFQVGHVPNCQALQYALGVCYVLSLSATSMLFLLRVLAVWHGYRAVRYVYIFLWVAMTGCAVTVPAAIKGEHIGPTLQCINTQVADFTVATSIMALIYDTAILAAISYRVVSNSVIEESFTTRIKTFFGRGRISRLSSALLQSGQHYYLVAVLGNIVLLVLVKLPNVPVVYHGMCTVPVLAFVNAMACIVFRKIKFGLITDAKPITGGSVSVIPSHYYRSRNTNGTDPTKMGIMVSTDTKVDTDQSFPIPLRDHMQS